MSRFLFVMPPLTGQAWAGHTHPAVPVGRELAARGHRVAWCGHPDVVPAQLPVGTTFFPVDSDVPRLPSQGRRGPAVVRALWEDVYLPLAREMVPGVQAAVDAFDPDALVVDQLALAGAAIATQRGLPWATTMGSAADVADPVASLPLVARWIRGLLDDLLVDVGVAPEEARAVDPRFSPYLTIAFMAEALAPVSNCPRGGRLVGPFLGDGADERRAALRRAAGERLGPEGTRKPLVLLDLRSKTTLSTVRLLALASQALASIG